MQMRIFFLTSLQRSNSKWAFTVRTGLNLFWVTCLYRYPQSPRTHSSTEHGIFLMVSLLILTTYMSIWLHAANKKVSHPPTSMICYLEVHWIAVTASSVSTNIRLQGKDFLASKLLPAMSKSSVITSTHPQHLFSRSKRDPVYFGIDILNYKVQSLFNFFLHWPPRTTS